MEKKIDPVEAEVLREFARKCPKLNAAIDKRRYLLPKVRQEDYANQDLCNSHFKRVIMEFALGRIGGRDSAAVESLNLVSALRYDRPLLYLERELGEDLVETELPEDITTEEIHWPWPAFRVMLPKGLIGAPAFDGKPMHGHYLDLTLWEGGTEMSLAREYAIELKALFGKRAPSVEEMTTTSLQGTSGFYLSSLTDYQQPGYQPDVASCMGNWTDWKLRDLITARPGQVLEGGPPEEINRAFLAKLRFIALHILLYLSQEPEIVLDDNWVRKPRSEGKHLISGLLRARFVGECMPKIRINPPVQRKEGYKPSGITLPRHFVRGHWQRVVYGKGRAFRRRQWIMPYWTTGEADEMKKGE